MIVFFDSTVFINDYPMTGPEFRTFLSSLLQIDAHLYVPQVVLDEVRNHHHEQVLAFREKYQKVMEPLLASAVRLGIPEAQPFLDAESVEQYHKDFVARLEEQLKAIGTTVVGYPPVSHEELVQRDLARKNLFPKKGRAIETA